MPESGFVCMRCPLQDMEEEDISQCFRPCHRFIKAGQAIGGTVLGALLHQVLLLCQVRGFIKVPHSCMVQHCAVCDAVRAVHCHGGQSRSVTLVLAHLMLDQQWTLREALDFVTQRRPQAKPNAGEPASARTYAPDRQTDTPARPEPLVCMPHAASVGWWQQLRQSACGDTPARCQR
jgi:Dual specificity phosphatase, catalytic domain